MTAAYVVARSLNLMAAGEKTRICCLSHVDNPFPLLSSSVINYGE